MTIEEALRFTVSAGVIAPGSEQAAAFSKTGAESSEQAVALPMAEVEKKEE